MHRIRSRGDGRGRDAARHHHERRSQLRRFARAIRDRLRHHPTARVRLLPRIKQINKIKLYLPDGQTRIALPGLGPSQTRPIRWKLIAEQYDQTRVPRRDGASVYLRPVSPRARTWRRHWCFGCGDVDRGALTPVALGMTIICDKLSTFIRGRIGQS